MRHSVGAMVAPVVVALAWLCGCTEESREAAADQMALGLLADVRAGDYPSWATMPGFEESQPSTSPHGQRVTIFVNSVLAESFEDGPPWPEGLLVVKDGWAEGDVIVRSLIRRDASGWFFAQFDFADRIIAAGYDDPMCISCHRAEDDYLLTAPEQGLSPPPLDDY